MFVLAAESDRCGEVVVVVVVVWGADPVVAAAAESNRCWGGVVVVVVVEGADPCESSEEVGEQGREREECGVCGDEGEGERVRAECASDASCDTRCCPLGAWSRCAMCFLHAGLSSLTS